MQVLHVLYEFLGSCSGAVEVSLLLGCGATSHWVISDSVVTFTVFGNSKTKATVNI